MGHNTSKQRCREQKKQLKEDFDALKSDFIDAQKLLETCQSQGGGSVCPLWSYPITKIADFRYFEITPVNSSNLINFKIVAPFITSDRAIVGIEPLTGVIQVRSTSPPLNLSIHCQAMDKDTGSIVTAVVQLVKVQFLNGPVSWNMTPMFREAFPIGFNSSVTIKYPTDSVEFTGYKKDKLTIEYAPGTREVTFKNTQVGSYDVIVVCYFSDSSNPPATSTLNLSVVPLGSLSPGGDNVPYQNSGQTSYLNELVEFSPGKTYEFGTKFTAEKLMPGLTLNEKTGVITGIVNAQTIAATIHDNYVVAKLPSGNVEVNYLAFYGSTGTGPGGSGSGANASMANVEKFGFFP